MLSNPTKQPILFYRAVAILEVCCCQCVYISQASRPVRETAWGKGRWRETDGGERGGDGKQGVGEGQEVEQVLPAQHEHPACEARQSSTSLYITSEVWTFLALGFNLDRSFSFALPDASPATFPASCLYATQTPSSANWKIYRQRKVK